MDIHMSGLNNTIINIKFNAMANLDGDKSITVNTVHPLTPNSGKYHWKIKISKNDRGLNIGWKDAEEADLSSAQINANVAPFTKKHKIFDVYLDSDTMKSCISDPESQQKSHKSLQSVTKPTTT